MKEKSIELDLDNLKKGFKALAKGARAAARAITKIFNELVSFENNLLSLINSRVCENNKIVRLAKSSRKKRTRKKNINRFIRLIEKEYNCKLLGWQKDYIRRLLNER